MSFAVQALSAEYLVQNRGKLPNFLISFPGRLDREVAMRKLRSMGGSIDTLSDEQKHYLGV